MFRDPSSNLGTSTTSKFGFAAKKCGETFCGSTFSLLAKRAIAQICPRGKLLGKVSPYGVRFAHCYPLQKLRMTLTLTGSLYPHLQI